MVGNKGLVPPSISTYIVKQNLKPYACHNDFKNCPTVIHVRATIKKTDRFTSLSELRRTPKDNEKKKWKYLQSQNRISLQQGS